jgi:uncharacterized membrane protein
MAYAWLKLIHVAAVILFVGNIVTGVFWKAHADRTGDPRLMAHVMDGIIASDRWFTMPGVIVIIVAGFAAAGIGGLPVLSTGWIFWSIVLFTISGLAFGFRLVPLQRRLAALAHAGSAGDFDTAAYDRLSRLWKWWGAVALLTPAAAVALMVLKPALPGL